MSVSAALQDIHIEMLYFRLGSKEYPHSDQAMTGSSTELPFPNCENSASDELLKEYYRPEAVIPGAMCTVKMPQNLPFTLVNRY
jgi:hypothetical protein